jgi:uridine kinase
MLQSQRVIMLDDLAKKIMRLSATRPTRIAVDGRTASGKTTLADELAEMIRQRGREVIRTSIDGFHRPKAERYARGRYSSEGYYYDARDLRAVMALLLNPLGPGGDRLYRTASFDLENDRALEQEPQRAPADSILIVDGTFLQRPELRDGWDLTVFVETSEDVSERRGVSRDAAQLGGAEATRKLYAERYRPAFALYEGLCAPLLNADVVLNNDDFDQLHMRIRHDGRLAEVTEDITPKT